MRIFPPEVGRAFSQTQTPAPVVVAHRLAPLGARLWVDGVLQTADLRMTPGLHYIVVERADLRPQARLQRVTRGAPAFSLVLTESATPKDAVIRAADRLRVGPLGNEEGIAVSALIRRPVWVVADPRKASQGSGTEGT